MKQIFFSILFLIITGPSLLAQDKIFRKNGKTVNAKVIEIGTADIKYKIPGDDNSLVYVLEKDRINKIEFENGKVEKFTADIKDPEQYIGQRTKAIKIDFLGPLIGYSQISFEKSTGVGKGYEVTLGVIGAGKNQRFNYYSNNVQLEKRSQFGISASFGFKFNKLPDFLFDRTRFNHLMQGAYAKPIIYVGNYSEDRLIYKSNNTYVVERPNTTFGALQLELGKQWVFSDKFLLDGYWGFGYGFDNKKDDGDGFNTYEDNSGAFNYINARAGRSPGFSLTYGIKLGLLIK